MPTAGADFSLMGKRALVTGASRGIGRALAHGFAAAGASVIAVARGNLESLIGELQKLNPAGNHLAVHCDLADREDRQQLWHNLLNADTIPHILCNNAGIIRRADFINFPASDWSEVLEINLTAVFDLSRKCAAELVKRQQPGRIINIHSLLSHQGGIRVAAYTAAKSGLQGLTRAMANELAAHAITVNGIVPGYIATDNTLPLRQDVVRNRSIIERIPAGRWGQPEDLMGAAVFLASPAAEYITGSEIVVDGGWLSR
ncbi:MAG: SDR family oxidoreductase [Verrucomicrobia bacterium]|nr:SDR family oxidoreductase [Verrucomicrobiota bacterium]